MYSRPDKIQIARTYRSKSFDQSFDAEKPKKEHIVQPESKKDTVSWIEIKRQAYSSDIQRQEKNHFITNSGPDKGLGPGGAGPTFGCGVRLLVLVLVLVLLPPLLVMVADGALPPRLPGPPPRPTAPPPRPFEAGELWFPCFSFSASIC